MLFYHQKLVDFGERIRLWLLSRRSFCYMHKRILRISETPHKVALGVAIGIFSACSPFLGLHIILALFFSWVLRGNFTAAIIGTVFSNPLTFLPIVMIDYKIGYLFLSLFGNVGEISFSQIRTIFGDLTFSKVWIIFGNTWDSIMLPMILGGILLGFVFGGLSYIGVYKAIGRFQQKRYQKMMQRVHLQQENSSNVL
ncbi:DUF2062 domain-containing protein [Bartonella sp. WD12.1]|uniref:DUF2062 domain-containing protein n=1 Tax=Bartonella sp. WD12.1 TaxID=1933903 RepID=UPI000999C2CF|nr:DUF2062 domain-containing protein [Bartonella sp. WD12.1]OPB29272.1 hypothetical protein BWD121_002840 [Bartonella sp. WD12.1]